MAEAQSLEFMLAVNARELAATLLLAGTKDAEVAIVKASSGIEKLLTTHIPALTASEVIFATDFFRAVASEEIEHLKMRVVPGGCA